MEKRKLILCRGIQASGKSTWAKAWAKEDPEHRVRFNNDDIRNMLGEYWVPNREGLVTELKHSFACEATRKGYNIVVDTSMDNKKNTNEGGTMPTEKFMIFTDMETNEENIVDMVQGKPLTLEEACMLLNKQNQEIQKLKLENNGLKYALENIKKIDVEIDIGDNNEM